MDTRMMIVDGSLAVENGPDGPDYTRYCSTHRWAGPTLPTISTSVCPHCNDGDFIGHNRFEKLMRRMAGTYGDDVAGMTILPPASTEDQTHGH